MASVYTEHAGAKDGGGAGDTRANAKHDSSRARRRGDRAAIAEGLADLDDRDGEEGAL